MLSLSPLARPWSLFEDSLWTGGVQGFLSGVVAPFVDRLIDRFSQWLDDLTQHGPSAPPEIALDDSVDSRLLVDTDGEIPSIRGVLGDPTDPAVNDGLALAITDEDTPRDALSVSVESSDTAIARAVLDGDDRLHVTPLAEGNATITVTVSDGESEREWALDYRAVDARDTDNAARFHTGTSDTSAAIAIGDGLLLVGDDEDQTLRLYDHDRSGGPLKSIDLNAALGLEGGDELDIESVVQVSDSLYYWLGSQGSDARATVFATRIEGERADELTVSVVGQFDGLRQAVVDWAAEAAPALRLDQGFEVEGAMFDAGTLYLGLRQPIDPEGRATVIPVTNAETLMAEGSAENAAFGAPLALDLEGRTIRDIKPLGDGTYLMIGGPSEEGDADETNDDFQLYRWDGAHKAALVEGVDLTTNADATGGTAETLGRIVSRDDGSLTVDVDYDNGTSDWSGTGVESKDLNDALETFTSTTVTVDALPSLSPEGGDVVPIAFGDRETDLSLVALAPVTPGATLTFESGDTRLTWTAPAEGVAAGTVISQALSPDQFTGTLDYTGDTGLEVRSGSGETLYRIGNADASADLSLPAGVEAAHYQGLTEGETAVLLDALGAFNNWREGTGSTPSGFTVATGHAPLAPPDVQDTGLSVTEIWPGQSGADVTPDWFEITNTSDASLDFAQDGLYYDDESAGAAEAVRVEGVDSLAPGETAIVLVDAGADSIAEFRAAWADSPALADTAIGYTGAAAGLGGGGDQVTLWLGDPRAEGVLAARTAYPDTSDHDGASWDVGQSAFTTRETGGIASTALGGDGADTPAVATPGVTDSDGDSPMSGGLLITEYVEGSGYTKALELTNTGAEALSLGGFTLSLYSNGASTATNTQPLEEYGTLAAGDSLVLANARADDALLARSDGTSSVINFNGNDALVLEGPDGEVVDTVGTVGSSEVFAADVTLRRDPSINTGSDTFDSAQWQQYPTDSLDDLGTFAGTGSDTTPDDGDSGEDAGGDTGDTLEGITLISTVQGEGMSSDLVGNTVTVDAIVTLDSQDGMDGFFIQEQDADRDDNAATAEGLFIYAPDGADVAVGDRVQVTGTVEQYEGRTELTNIAELDVLARDQALPEVTELTLPIEDKASLAAFEGMRVAVTAEDDAPLTVTDTYELGRYGTVTLASGGRLEQYTEGHAPDQVGYQQWLDEVEQRSIVLDDASNAQNPETIVFGRDGEPLSADNTLRGGDTLQTATGVLDFNQQQWRVQSTEGQDFQATNARTDAPDTGALGDASLKVASFNVLNYFTTLDEGDATVTTPAGTEHDPRGADSAVELARQQARLVEAINSTDADVVGLMEIENDGYGDGSSISTLVDALNADAPSADWAYITPRDDAGNVVAPGSDAIAVGMIYKAGAVTPEGEAAVNTDGVFATGNRAPLLQSFTETDSGETFSVVVNHFKSKGSVIDGQEAIGDGQGNNNPIRVEAAEQLSEWLASDPTGSGDSDTLIIGDLNSYAMEDPITALTEAGFTLLDDDYSYSYDGQWGSLDHALASESLADQVTGTTTWHINADEPYVLDYNTEYKSDAQQASLYSDGAYRASDHDPVIVGLNLGGPRGDAALME